MTLPKMKMELAVLFPPFKFVVLPALTSSHKTSLLQHISPQEGRPSANRSWILFSPHRAGAEIGIFQNAAGHNPVFYNSREKKSDNRKKK